MPRPQKLALRLLLALLLLYTLLFIYPVRTTYTREALLAVPAALLACLTILLWRRKILRWIPLVLPAALATFLLLPGRPIDRTALRNAYVARLHAFQGTRYVWGGEGFFGTDCSGLLRAALVDAHARQALRTLNPALARDALSLWWHDAFARDLADPARNLTTRLAWTGPLRDAPQTLLQPGNLAITADGSHALAYAGCGTWIEADPYALRVITLPPNTESQWSNTQITPHRWRCLADQ